VLFFIGGLLSGFVSGASGALIGKALKEGVLGLAPGVPLILMAASTKHIVSNGKSSTPSCTALRRCWRAHRLCQP